MVDLAQKYILSSLLSDLNCLLLRSVLLSISQYLLAHTLDIELGSNLSLVLDTDARCIVNYCLGPDRLDGIFGTINCYLPAYVNNFPSTA